MIHAQRINLMGTRYKGQDVYTNEKHNMHIHAQRINVLGYKMCVWGYDVCTKGKSYVEKIELFTLSWNHFYASFKT